MDKYNTEDSFALSLAKGSICGYIRKEEYNNLMGSGLAFCFSFCQSQKRSRISYKCIKISLQG
jgi:hypothetical protein